MTDTKLKPSSIIGAIGSIAVAILGLLGYLPGMGLLGSIRENYIPMAPSTAISFIILGFILLILNAKRLSGTKATISLVATLLVSLFGILEVAGYFSGIDLNFEDTLVPAVGKLNGVPIARMSPATGAAFFLSGVAAFFLILQRKPLKRNTLIEYFGSGLGILILLISFVFCLAYLYGTPLLYGHGATIPMALTTALGFVFLSVSILTSGKDTFPLRLLTDSSTRSYLLRFILPLSTLSVVLGGMTVLLAEQTSRMNPAFMSAALTVLIAMITGFVATLISRHMGSKIDRSEAAVKQANEELQESEERYRAIAEDMPVLICRFLPNGEITYVNEAYCSCFDKTFEELVGQAYLPLIAEADREAVMDGISALTIESPTQSHEHRVIAPDGKIRWQHWTNRALFDAQGKAIAYQAIGEDITERKQAEAALRESEEKFRSTFENSPIAMTLCDNSGKHVKVNDAITKIFGYSEKELLSMKINDLTYPGDTDQKSDIVQNMWTGESDGFSIEKRYIHKDGYIMWGDATVSPVLDSEGKVQYLLGQIQDITDRKRAEEALRESEENLRTTLNSIGDAVIATDINGNVTHLNPIAEKITGWKFEESKGRQLVEIFNIINSQTRKVAENPVDKVLANGRIIGPVNNTILVAKNGMECQIADSAAPIKDVDGNISGVVLVFRDVTKQLKIEKELFKVRKLESVGVLAGGIAHDFNNILTGLFGNIELAKQKLPRDHAAYAYIETADQALERATNLTKQLLIFAKGGDPLLEAVNMGQVIHESIVFSLSGSNVKTVLNLPDDLWEIKADKGQLSQIISNLTINAKQAMPGGGALYIDAENIKDIKEDIARHLSGDFVKLSMRDEGLGISPKHIERIFDPYFSTKQTGSGLGLATVHNIIAKHGGHISVDSKLGIGATFTIYFPAEKSSHKTTDTIPPSVTEKSASTSRHILVMDDEEMIRDLSVAVLESYGYTVDSVADGEEALERCMSAAKKGCPFDVVIMDLTIPGGMGGEEAVKKLLAVDPDAKVVVSSGYSTDPIMANYSDYGFKGRLVKPFEIRDLEKELSRVMEAG